MNKIETLELIKRLSLVNSMCGVSMANDAIMYQASLLADLEFNAVLEAIDGYMKTNKTGRPPTAAHIREIVSPEPDSRELAVALARKIDRAISKYGWIWSSGVRQDGQTYYEGGGILHHTFKDAVVAELGDIGWHVICSRGSWEQLRNSANEMEEGQFIAQMRDLIQASYNLKKQGIDILAIEMPKRKNEEGLIQISDFKLKSI